MFVADELEYTCSSILLTIVNPKSLILTSWFVLSLAVILNFKIGLFFNCTFTIKLSAGSVIFDTLFAVAILLSVSAFSSCTLLTYPFASNVTTTFMSVPRD